MSLNLLNSFGKRGVDYGLYTKDADLIDPEYLSRYFVVSEFNPTFTAGKNAFLFNGSNFLKTGSEILVQAQDSVGNILYLEMAKYSGQAAKTYAYKESTAFVFAFHVYNDTADGVGKIILYGTLIDGRTVKWIQNITINKTLKNSSKVRFYLAPELNVDSDVVPVLSSSISTGLVDIKTMTGRMAGVAFDPPKDTNQATVNSRNTDVDYRLTITNPVITPATSDDNAINSQMVNSYINLNIDRIQYPTTQYDVDAVITASYLVKDAVTSNTLKISIPFFSKDQGGNDTVTNISDAYFSITYPFVNYNTNPTQYETTTIGGVTYVVKSCYGDITYKNIRTFSGYVARHKVYRKSLVSSADWSVIADEPVGDNEILQDNLTQNKYFQRLGVFYNDQHIARYWFTSSTNFSLTHTPYVAINSARIYSTNPMGLVSDYALVKNDSVTTNRDAIYVPYDAAQQQIQSGSAYDSNFMELKANVQYIFELSAIIEKGFNQTNAELQFYFTSSVPDAQKEKAYDSQFGIKIANIAANQSGSTKFNVENLITFFTPQEDLFGTLVIVPKYCNAYIKDLSFRVYGDDGFSPDTFTTRIPWPISVANESYQIRAELFDINQNLVYSDLATFQNFDPNGESLIPYIPGGGSQAGDFTVGHNLIVGNDAFIGNNLYLPNITARPTGNPALSQSRILSVRADGAIVFDPMVDIAADDKYLYLSLGSATSRLSTTITTKKSISSEYDALGGRKIYWVGGIKVVESSP